VLNFKHGGACAEETIMRLPHGLLRYDESTETVQGSGDTTDAARSDAKEKAEKPARREAELAMKEAEASSHACKEGGSKCPHGCVAWFRLLMGDPKSQEYPFHSSDRQFAFGWCRWQLLVKCECVSSEVPKKDGQSKPKGKVY
jgi:hypothetical protein